ncbi:MAG: chemotaxis response regulator protein-glutamate methylesterase [Geobacteraceae bacterium]|nr:chemotaxis response regulator protein-glutamate methylesterase [Geobacteraceae bacterium]
MPNQSDVKQKIRVLVVDDSAFVRRAIIRMFENSPEISIIDVAADGEMAIDLIKRNRPDVVTLDVQMPVLDGLSALARIMKECPTPVIMLSSLTGKGGDQTLKALDLGAVDFIDKSSAGGSMEFNRLQQELISKILVAARIDLSKIRSQSEKAEIHTEKPSTSQGIVHSTDSEAIFVGTSTGGPPALMSVLSALPPSIRVPLFIVQHMPVGFTASLAQRLDKACRIRVKEAENNEIATPGTAYIAPGGMQMTVKRSKRDGEVRICLDELPTDTLHKPSVDVLFQSAAEQFGNKSLAFVLTGMGKDGSVGATLIKKAGGRIYVESEMTSVVFGMPKAVMDAVTVDGVLPLQSMAETMVKLT